MFGQCMGLGSSSLSMGHEYSSLGMSLEYSSLGMNLVLLLFGQVVYPVSVSVLELDLV